MKETLGKRFLYMQLKKISLLQGGIVMNDQIKKNRKNEKQKKLKRLYKIVKETIKFIGIIGTTFSVVSGVSIYAAISMVSKKVEANKPEGTSTLWFLISPCADFIINHFFILIAISFFIALIVNLKIIPKREIEKGKPPVEAKPSLLRASFLFTGSCTSLIICCMLIIYAMEEPTDDPSIITEPIPEAEENEESNDGDFLVLSEEQLKIENYIKRCCTEIISNEELKELSNSELKYIRNGIYAYEGRYYESGYYDVFTWYERKILPDKFTSDMLNEVEMTNILNIRAVEIERGTYK